MQPQESHERNTQKEKEAFPFFWFISQVMEELD
jgi:hypothetical protein